MSFARYYRISEHSKRTQAGPICSVRRYNANRFAGTLSFIGRVVDGNANKRNQAKVLVRCKTKFGADNVPPAKSQFSHASSIFSHLGRYSYALRTRAPEMFHSQLSTTNITLSLVPRLKKGTLMSRSSLIVCSIQYQCITSRRDS